MLMIPCFQAGVPILNKKPEWDHRNKRPCDGHRDHMAVMYGVASGRLKICKMNEFLPTDRTLKLKIRTSYELKYNFSESDGVTIPNLGHLFDFALDVKTSSSCNTFIMT